MDRGKSIDIFKVVSLPSPLGLGFKAWHEPLEEWHALFANAVLWLLVLHLAGVFKHQVIDGDGLLWRMLPGRGRTVAGGTGGLVGGAGPRNI